MAGTTRHEAYEYRHCACINVLRSGLVLDLPLCGIFAMEWTVWTRKDPRLPSPAIGLCGE